MDDAQTMCAMEIDESYVVKRVLADHEAGVTELVTSEGGELCVRKRIPRALANPQAWATAMMLDCPRVARVVQLYTLPDQLVVVTEYVPGKSLSEVVSSEGPLDLRGAATVALQLAEATSALHAVGIVHRDIKPSNVVMSSNGAVLVDLGSARLHDESAARDTTLLGTAGFAAPEQYGFAQTDARSDIYSIGRLMAYLVEGDGRGGGGSSVATGDGANGHVSGVVNAMNPLDVNALRRYSSDAYAAIAQKCCAFEPSARYQNDAELMGALRELLDQAGTADMAASVGVALATHRGTAPVDRSTPSPTQVVPSPLDSDAGLAADGESVTNSKPYPVGVGHADPKLGRRETDVSTVAANLETEAISEFAAAGSTKADGATVMGSSPAKESATGLARSTGLARLLPRVSWDELREGYDRADGRRKAAAWTLGVLGALFVLLLLYSIGFAPHDQLAQRAPWLYPVAYVTLAVASAWDAFELVEWALCCGPYQARDGRLRRLVVRLLAVAAVSFALLVIEVILALAIGG